MRDKYHRFKDDYVQNKDQIYDQKDLIREEIENFIYADGTEYDADRFEKKI